MRQHRTFRISNPSQFKRALLEWSRPFSKVVWLDSNGHAQKYSSFDFLLAVDIQTDKSNFVDMLDQLKIMVDQKQDWLFGFFTYDIKNQLEDLVSQNFDGLGFPTLHFFQPSKIIKCIGGNLHFMYLEDCADEIESDFAQIKALVNFEKSETEQSPVKIKMRIHKDAYFEKVTQLLEHIHRGDVYEANFCQEFYAEDVSIDPWETYQRLNSISEPPFATFMRLEDKYLMCASPERYLRKQGSTLISQPIKGTARRDDNETEDEKLKHQLALDEKERAENIMITDLVRNDLSKSALRGSVEVEELCKVYTYKQVHQMISTVIAEIPADKNPVELIEETFPMGSMTGAPKISAMKIIEELEETKRGLYSGAVGYFDPDGNFDFNVVIRSILYNSTRNYVSYSVGSAITAKSNPEHEYQECLLKAKAMRSVLETGE
ncbi:anthranilate synthase component I family protein [Flagellimonas iocasae]|uniref:Anthranilate synthase component I family protein n=1 Tax=Flagellimonas iocasae TaxID=2055905 RepID=A0ABW4XX27_9FLAO